MSWRSPSPLRTALLAWALALPATGCLPQGRRPGAGLSLADALIAAARPPRAPRQSTSTFLWGPPSLPGAPSPAPPTLFCREVPGVGLVGPFGSPLATTGPGQGQTTLWGSVRLGIELQGGGLAGPFSGAWLGSGASSGLTTRWVSGVMPRARAGESLWWLSAELAIFPYHGVPGAFW